MAVLTGQQYPLDRNAISGMGPMPYTEDHMAPDAIWGAYCNVCKDGRVGPQDIVGHWYFTIHPCGCGSPQPKNIREYAEWELLRYSRVSGETVQMLLLEIDRLNDIILGHDLVGMCKELDGISDQTA